MKIIIEIPEKTNARIRSDYGHGLKALRCEDREIVCDAIYNCTPYKERPHGEWINNNGIVSPFWERYECSECGARSDNTNFCPNCGSDNRPKEKTETNDRDCGSCVHYKLYKDNDLYACELWECKYEPRDKED